MNAITGAPDLQRAILESLRTMTAPMAQQPMMLLANLREFAVALTREFNRPVVVFPVTVQIGPTLATSLYAYAVPLPGVDFPLDQAGTFAAAAAAAAAPPPPPPAAFVQPAPTPAGDVAASQFTAEQLERARRRMDAQVAAAAANGIAIEPAGEDKTPLASETTLVRPGDPEWIDAKPPMPLVRPGDPGWMERAKDTIAPTVAQPLIEVRAATATAPPVDSTD